MKIDMTKLRWVLLAFYLIIVFGLFGTGLTGVLDLPVGLQFFDGLEGDPVLTIMVLLATVMSQAVFIWCSGTINLCRPFVKRAAFLPSIMAAFLLTVLVVATCFSLFELTELDGDDDYLMMVFWIIIGINWVGWSIAFLATYAQHERFTATRKVVSTLLGGSLLELLVTIPSHIVVSRRPGCFVGMLTAAGISSGIAVMLWAFGPGIVFLFLRATRKGKLSQNTSRKSTA